MKLSRLLCPLGILVLLLPQFLAFPSISTVAAAYSPRTYVTPLASGYSVTFQESGIPAAVTWGVTVGGTRYTSSSSSLQVSGLTSTISYLYDAFVPGSDGVRYACQSGCSGSVSHATTVKSSYSTQYRLRMEVSSSLAGSTVPPVGDNWNTKGAKVTINVSPNSGWRFQSWTGSGSGSYTGSTKSKTLTLKGPITEVANFLQSAGPIGPAIASVFSNSSTLGFEVPAIVADESAVGYMISHRLGSKVMFSNTDPIRVIQGTSQLTFSDYSNAVVVGNRGDNPTVAFYEGNGMAPFKEVVNLDGTVSILYGSTVALHVALSAITSSNDYFVMEQVNDGGHKILMFWGIQTQGTVASGVFFDMMFSKFSSAQHSASAYLIHWQDTNKNGIPDPADSFTVAFAGS